MELGGCNAQRADGGHLHSPRRRKPDAADEHALVGGALLRRSEGSTLYHAGRTQGSLHGRAQLARVHLQRGQLRGPGRCLLLACGQVEHEGTSLQLLCGLLQAVQLLAALDKLRTRPLSAGKRVGGQLADACCGCLAAQDSILLAEELCGRVHGCCVCRGSRDRDDVAARCEASRGSTLRGSAACTAALGELIGKLPVLRLGGVEVLLEGDQCVLPGLGLLGELCVLLGQHTLQLLLPGEQTGDATLEEGASALALSNVVLLAGDRAALLGYLRALPLDLLLERAEAVELLLDGGGPRVDGRDGLLPGINCGSGDLVGLLRELCHACGQRRNGGARPRPG
mmetsp:Transcript_17030/g.66362  ORF Transcript_17030/g.66362 Transcript_17030/m.66362 type:complete len:340 (+) Transcript_17030:63-1082(+)